MKPSLLLSLVVVASVAVNAVVAQEARRSVESEALKWRNGPPVD